MHADSAPCQAYQRGFFLVLVMLPNIPDLTGGVVCLPRWSNFLLCPPPATSFLVPIIHRLRIALCKRSPASILVAKLHAAELEGAGEKWVEVRKHFPGSSEWYLLADSQICQMQGKIVKLTLFCKNSGGWPPGSWRYWRDS